MKMYHTALVYYCLPRIAGLTSYPKSDNFILVASLVINNSSKPICLVELGKKNLRMAKRSNLVKSDSPVRLSHWVDFW